MSMGRGLCILRAMRRPPVFRQACYWVLALLLFAVRSADAHVHMCLDGQESRASLHLADGRVHHAGSEADGKHADKDFAYAGDGATKKAETGDSSFLPVAPTYSDFLFAYAEELPQPLGAVLPPTTDARLRPPLRGPPR